MTTDPTYGDGGSVVVPQGDSYDLLLGPRDSVFVITGDDTEGRTPRVRRIDPTGRLDQAYGTNGTVIAPAPPVPRLNRATAQTRVVSGASDDLYAFSTYGSVDSHSREFLNVAVAHILPDGRRDGGYGTGGFARLTIPVKSSSYDGPVVDASGRLLFTTIGRGRNSGTSAQSDGYARQVFRFSPTGRLDRTFSGDGRAVYTDVSTTAMAFDVVGDSPVFALQTDYRKSKRAVGNAVRMVRLRPNGTLDTTYGGDGTQLVKFPDDRRRPDAVIFDDSGRTYIEVCTGPISRNTCDSIDWEQYFASGRRNTTFATRTTPVRANTDGRLFSSVLDILDGRLLVYSSRLDGPGPSLGFNLDGSPREALGPGGAFDVCCLGDPDGPYFYDSVKDDANAVHITRLRIDETEQG